jgi:hypothetical protein
LVQSRNTFETSLDAGCLVGLSYLKDTTNNAKRLSTKRRIKLKKD